MSKGFHVPPSCQGQIVEVAYMCAGNQMLRRTTDRSDGSVAFAIAPIKSHDWKWYETYEQCNGEPPIPESRWRRTDERTVEDLADEWA